MERSTAQPARIHISASGRNRGGDASVRRFTRCITLFTVACYTYLDYGHSEMQPDGDASREAFDMHVLRMWATFVFSALLIAFLLQRMASAIRERDQLLARKREEEIRNEHIVALGTMAVGAAHALGTPLTTMAVIASDLQDECVQTPELVRDIQTLQSQIAACKREADPSHGTVGKCCGYRRAPGENYCGPQLLETDCPAPRPAPTSESKGAGPYRHYIRNMDK